MKLILKYLPFVAIIAVNSMAIAGRYRLEFLKPYVLVISLVVLLNVIVAVLSKVRSYFTYAVSGMVLLGAVGVFLVPALGRLYLENAIACLYVSLFMAALLPPLIHMGPFTYEYSKKDYPDAVTRGAQFKRINLIINYLWAALFGVCICLSLIRYSADDGLQVILSGLVPIVLLLAVGIPMTRKLPSLLMQKTRRKRLHFDNVNELFEAMPYGLNKEAAKGVDTIVQFHLTGKEPVDGYLSIKNGNCSYQDGRHPDPMTTIRADSELWLAISNKEVSGAQAFINKRYTVDGDSAILLKLDELFSPSPATEEAGIDNQDITRFDYSSFAPGRIKKIVVFDGGPRDTSFSKTTYMVSHFCDGARSSGADIETVKLKDMKINPCTGCYTCWTKTPGECIFKDDMPELLKKFRNADLIVFASPLYIFNVTGIMKTFLDRLIPNAKPYMIGDGGLTKHPHRYPEDREQGFVVFSAAGFPEVEHNFDGLKGMFRCFHRHFEKTSMVGEFYLPAAELIAQPVYAERRKHVEKACYSAGKQIAEEGKIDIKLMETVSDIQMTQAKFKKQADWFWESLDGKGSYLRNAPRFETWGTVP